MKIDHNILLSRNESEVSNRYYKLERTYLRNIRNCSYYYNYSDDENVIIIIIIIIIIYWMLTLYYSLH